MNYLIKNLPAHTSLSFEKKQLGEETKVDVIEIKIFDSFRRTQKTCSITFDFIQHGDEQMVKILLMEMLDKSLSEC